MAQETKQETGASETPEVEVIDNPTRDQVRTAILDAKPESEFLTINGVRVEVRAPLLEDLLQYRNASEDDSIMARAIVNNVYVPGTGERVFDAADIPALMKSSFSSDMKRLNKAVTSVLGGDEDILEAVDNQTKRDSE